MKIMSSDNNSLYVRIEEEDEINEDLEDIESIIGNIEELSELVRQTDQIKKESVQHIKQNVAKLEDRLNTISSSLPGDEQVPNPSTQDTSDDDIDGSVGELHSELENLQEELSDLD